MSADTPVRAPGLLNLALEARAPFEYAASLLAAPWLLSAPRGDGHAVIVYPGFLASDFSTRPLRRLLRTLGHDARGWAQGRNVGARAGTLERALDHLRQTHRATGRSVSLVGWSLGGLYARELAKMAPDSVRFVVTLGSPFTGPPQATNAFRLYQWLHRDHGPAPRLPDELTVPPPQPCTSIYSRSDGVVAWPCSLAEPRAADREHRGACQPCRPGRQPAGFVRAGRPPGPARRRLAPLRATRPLAPPVPILRRNPCKP